MIFLMIISIFISILIGYLGYFYSKNMIVGLLLVTVVGLIFPLLLGDSSFLVFGLLINIVLYLILIMFLKKR